MAAKKKTTTTDGPKTLTPKQRRFAELYDGNGTQAARAAGYAGSDKVLAEVARENLGNPGIVALIRSRESKALKPQIMTREERQAFWSEVARGAGGGEMRDRLRASELLGKSNADFVERHEHALSLSLEQMVLQSIGSTGSQVPPSAPVERDGSGGAGLPGPVRSPALEMRPDEQRVWPEDEEAADGAEHRPDVPGAPAERPGEGEG